MCTQQIYNSEYIPGKLYKMVFDKPLYREKDLYRVYKRTKSGDIILILGVFIIKRKEAIKLIYGTEILHTYIFNDTKYKIVELCL